MPENQKKSDAAGKLPQGTDQQPPRPSAVKRPITAASQQVPVVVPIRKDGVVSDSVPIVKPVDQDFDVELVTELIPYATIVPPGTPPPDDPKAILKVVLCDDKPVVESPPTAKTADWLNELEPPCLPVQTVAQPKNATPDWLSEVAESDMKVCAAPPSTLGPIPDWLADIQQLEESAGTSIPPTIPDGKQ